MKGRKTVLSGSAVIAAACCFIYVLADLIALAGVFPYGDAAVDFAVVLEEISLFVLAASLLLRNRKAAAVSVTGYALSVLVIFVADLSGGFCDWIRVLTILSCAMLVFLLLRSGNSGRTVRRFWFVPAALFILGIPLYPSYYPGMFTPDWAWPEWLYLVVRTLAFTAALVFAGLWLKSEASASGFSAAGSKAAKRVILAAAAVFIALAAGMLALPRENGGSGYVFTPMPAEAEPFTGAWQSDRASADIRWYEEDNEFFFRVSVLWSSSAWENSEWIYRCDYNTADNTLVSRPGGERTDYVHDENGLASSTVVYRDGAAVFSLDRDGSLAWQDAKESAGAGLRFERLSIVPEYE